MLCHSPWDFFGHLCDANNNWIVLNYLPFMMLLYISLSKNWKGFLNYYMCYYHMSHPGVRIILKGAAYSDKAHNVLIQCEASNIWMHWQLPMSKLYIEKILVKLSRRTKVETELNVFLCVARKRLQHLICDRFHVWIRLLRVLCSQRIILSLQSFVHPCSVLMWQ